MTFQHIITVSDRNASKRGNLQQVVNTMSKMSKHVCIRNKLVIK